MTERPHVHIDGVLYVECDMCEQFAISRCQDQAFLPDEGMSVTFTGWYGGFTDSFPAALHDEQDPPPQYVCHDCALKLWRMFPKLRGQRGLHSTREDVVCCEYQWTFGHDEDGNIDRTIYGDGTSRRHKDHRMDHDAPLVREFANPWENLPD